MGPTKAGAPRSVARSTSKLNVFVSYSRQESAFVDRLQGELAANGIEAFVDRDHIEKSEAWWTRITQLITEADTVVFVLSPGSIDSKVCADEVAFAEKLNKRFVPIVARDLEGRDAPAALARLNYIFFIPTQTAGASDDFNTAIGDLVRALETDIPWIREHTRLGAMAERWEAHKRPSDLLLRGAELASAETWLTTRPEKAPDPTDAHRALVTLSRQGATRRQRTVAIGAVVLAIASGGLALWAEVNRREAAAERASALLNQSRAVAEKAQRFLDENNHAMATRLSLSVLPDSNGKQFSSERPFSPEAARVLFNAAASITRTFVHPGRKEQTVARVTQTPDAAVLIQYQDGFAAHLQRHEDAWKETTTHTHIRTLVAREKAGQFLALTHADKFVVLENEQRSTITPPSPLHPEFQTALGPSHVVNTKCDGFVSIWHLEESQTTNNGKGDPGFSLRNAGEINIGFTAPAGRCARLSFAVKGSRLQIETDAGFEVYDLGIDETNHKKISKYHPAFDSKVEQISYSETSIRAAVLLSAGEIAVSHSTDASPICAPKTISGRATSIALSPDGLTLLVGLETGHIETWEISTCRKKSEKSLTFNRIDRILLSSSGHTAAITDSIGTAFLVTLNELAIITSEPPGLNPVVGALALETPGQLLTVRRDGSVQVVMPSTADQIANFEGITEIIACGNDSIITVSDTSKLTHLQPNIDSNFRSKASNHNEFFAAALEEQSAKMREIPRYTGYDKRRQRLWRRAEGQIAWIGSIESERYLDEERNGPFEAKPELCNATPPVREPYSEDKNLDAAKDSSWEAFKVGSLALKPSSHVDVLVVDQATKQVLASFRHNNRIVSVAVAPEGDAVFLALKDGVVARRPFFASVEMLVRSARQINPMCLTEGEKTALSVNELSAHCVEIAEHLGDKF